MTSKSERIGWLGAMAAGIVALGVSLAAHGAIVSGQPNGQPRGGNYKLGLPDLDKQLSLSMTQSLSTRQILPGQATNVMVYSGRVLSGSPDGLGAPIPGSYLGPTIEVQQGWSVSINMKNELGVPSVTHWHGLDVPDTMDGHPRFAIPSGGTYQYKFKVLNRAGTYWYHPHPDMQTGTQVLNGLAGLFIVHDEEEARLNLPSGKYDVPVVIQDRNFDSANQFLNNPNGIDGLLASTVLVNGKANYEHSCSTSVYRVRLLNGSHSRIYKLAFTDGTPLTVIGSDGGLLAQPIVYPYIMLSPGERVELWLDLRGKTLGTKSTLRSSSFAGAGGAQGVATLDIMNFSIDYPGEPDSRVLPTNLSEIQVYRLQDAVNVNTPKTYAITRVNGVGYLLNGAVFDMLGTSANEVATCGTLEVITITNTTSSPNVAHPIHFHGRQFQILDRTTAPSGVAGWNNVKDGVQDTGWKDTFMIMPQQTVRLLVRHGKYPGLYNWHCHNLVHEDMGMMRNFRLQP